MPYLYETIKDYLMKLITENKNNSAYKLPSENQLALKFNTTRVTAKRALVALTDEGYIYRMHGKGSFIKKNFNTPLPSRGKDFVCMFCPNLCSNFISDIIKGATAYLESSNVELIVCTNNENNLASRSILTKIVDMGTKGIIFFPFENESYNKDLMFLVLNNFPVVFIDRTLPNIDISAVTSNHFEASRSAVTLLMQKDAKQIGFISTAIESATSITDRKRGYEQAHIDAERAMKNSNILIIDDKDPNLIDIMVDYLLSSKVDAVISSGDIIGLNLMRAIKKLNLSVPNDLQVVFYDDEYASFCDLLPFAPTCIQQNAFRIGREAALIVSNLIRTNNCINERLSINCSIIERDSTKH